MKKKKWTKPQLIVLVRGGQEERVLVACKWDSTVDPNQADMSCVQIGPCVGCDVRTSS